MTHVLYNLIPMKEGVKIFQLKLKKVYPMLKPMIYKEIKNILDVKIILKFRHSKWVDNLVHVRNK